MERNSGLFWAMLQCSLLIGNTFVYFQFQGLEDIDKDTRTKVRILTKFTFFLNQLDCCFDTQPFLIDKTKLSHDCGSSEQDIIVRAGDFN